MRIFYTADLHIGHRMVAESRGFPDAAAHDAELARLWDQEVDIDDQVWVLGDISVGGTKNETTALRWLAHRSGRKHLVCGNHDGCHPMRSKAARWQRVYLEVFDSVQQTAVHKITGHRVLLSHFPFRGDPEGDHTPVNRFEEWRHPDGGQWLLHGHTHSRESQRGRQLHIGLDAHNLSVVPQQWVIDRITTGSYSAPPMHQEQLSAQQLQQLRDATLHYHTVGEYPADLPEPIRRFTEEPDGGLLGLIDLAITQARKLDNAVAGNLTDTRIEPSTPL
ncbi:metallophosphoesterase family protein [Nocardia sp. 004]|uniref:metallophosphoesterase family protein n=1 Tax=Nocardia sp. 004 TaxID=3385978 RepID=UPI0039A03636